VHARWPDQYDSGASTEDIVMVIKVQYDAYNRTFKLVDSAFRTLLEGDAIYDLEIPLMLEDGDEELFAVAGRFVAHA
jgi:hypothetical protein